MLKAKTETLSLNVSDLKAKLEQTCRAYQEWREYATQLRGSLVGIKACNSQLSFDIPPAPTINDLVMPPPSALLVSPDNRSGLSGGQRSRARDMPGTSSPSPMVMEPLFVGIGHPDDGVEVATVIDDPISQD